MSNNERTIITPEMAAKEILFRNSARDNLIDFARYVQKTYEADPFHYLLADYLQKVEEGSIDRLIITTPPRHGKSELASIKFPAWFMARNPNNNVIQASYNLEQATRSSRFTRDIIEGDLFPRVFPEISMSPHSRAADRWMLDNGQEYFGVGIGTGTTGKGGHCLTASAMIETNYGLMSVADIVTSKGDIRVLSYDHNTENFVWKKCTAFADRIVDGVYRITTSSGRVVEATGEHPFFANGDYVKADILTAGDRLLCSLPYENNSDGIRVSKSREDGDKRKFLRSEVLVESSEQKKSTLSKKMSSLQSFASSKKRKLVEVLFRRLSFIFPQRKVGENDGISGKGSDIGDRLPVLQRDVLTEIKNQQVLLHGMQEWISRLSYDGQKQSELAKRDEPTSATAPLCKNLSDKSSENHSAGQFPVCGLRFYGEASGSSYQHEPIGQPPQESCDDVRRVSYDMARRGTFETTEDTVALVEYIRGSAQVYNIQVEGTENFFANEILTHNCIIIDDPYKDSEECDSPTMREKVWDWYNSVVLTRLERGGRIILIQTRWHFDDLAGRLMNAEKTGGDKWTVLKLPAICTDPKNDLMGRELGEALSPGRKNIAELERIKRGITPRFWSAMFQQEPISEEGALFQAKWFDTADRIPLGMKRVRAWDFGSTSDGDYTVGVLMARDTDGVFYIEDVVRDRVTPLHVERLVRQTAENDRKRHGSVQIIIPQDPGQAGVAQAQSYIRRMAGFRIKSIRPTGDKETRASGLAAQAEAKMVKLKAGTWNKEFTEELSLFPFGAHDDQVDAAADAFNGLLGPGQARILDW